MSTFILIMLYPIILLGLITIGAILLISNLIKKYKS
ncbi:hypothetical protein EUAN_24120 [Andreesenia angusta]|uniref:Uncharacterized protein n=1 Tax=Andreesenia angusta TaxID=39480 RepID=A0A1S1V3P6_9FIRM|nr:hypothetical protein EUAN_24120 [Andreesenia angusta]